MQRMIDQKKYPSGWQVTLSGTGEAIVLLPGFAESSSIWEQTATWLEKKFRLILIDYPGNRSHPYNLDCIQSLEDMAAELHEVLQTVNATSVHLFGHSMGGYLALAYWELFPQAVSSVGLIHSTAEADDEQKKKLRSKVMEHLKTENPKRILSNSIPALFSNPEKYKEVIQQLIETGCLFRNDALISFYKSMRNRPDRTHLLRQTTIPVLMVAGKEDKAVAYERLQLQAKLSRKCVLKSLDQVGHMGMFEEPGILNEILLEFLDSTDQQK